MFYKFLPWHTNYKGEKMDKSIKDILDKIPFDLINLIHDNTTEIRLRSNCNISLLAKGVYMQVDNSVLSVRQIENILLQFCEYTMPAYENRISQGYITLSGGHRVGIAGFYHEVNGKYLLKKVTSLNIRLNRNNRFEPDKNIISFSRGLLVIGGPHSGKTTFLRSIIPYLDGSVTVCDERNEIYSDHFNCDFICGINKAAAISRSTRSLNPDYIICDEIGSESEAQSILSRVNSGVKFICTAHCDSIEYLKYKPNINLLIKNHIFDKIVLLVNDNGNFHMKEIRDV